MKWKIELSLKADKALDKLDKQDARRILTFLHERVRNLEHPRQIGEPLTGSKLGNYWKYRVGDYRIICEIQDQELRVIAIHIGHRRDVYR